HRSHLSRHLFCTESFAHNQSRITSVQPSLQASLRPACSIGDCLILRQRYRGTQIIRGLIALMENEEGTVGLENREMMQNPLHGMHLDVLDLGQTGCWQDSVYVTHWKCDLDKGKVWNWPNDQIRSAGR